MKHLVLVDIENDWKQLLPLTFTRSVSQIRIGILTIEEKWMKYFPDVSVSFSVQPHLAALFPFRDSDESLYVRSSVLPDEHLLKALSSLNAGQSLYSGTEWVAFKGNSHGWKKHHEAEKLSLHMPVKMVSKVYDIFKNNGEAISDDFKLLTNRRQSAPLSKSVTVIGDANLVFLEEGAVAEACIINTKGGPVYLGKESEMMEGGVVRGPFALCEHSVLKLSAKIYGPTTIGPHSKVGGEVNNSVIFGYSNKAHDGFLGNSVIGEWCNLGADTNNSNLKNNYANVKLYNYSENRPLDTGLQFCGLIMGDYSKSGINTMFNTGTVVGVGANIFGGGFPPTHLPSFTWGGSESLEVYRLEKLFETSEKVFERRGLVFGNREKEMLKGVFELTDKDRKGL